MTIVHSLDVWLDGFPEPAGRLDKYDDKSIGFTYAGAFLEAGPHPLSMSLPLSEGTFGDALTHAFFGNLLPENDQMRRIMDRERLGRDDVVGILHFVGADCAGAISCLPAGSPPAKVPGVLAEDYRPLSDAELAEIANSLANEAKLPEGLEDPSPLAGVQRKIALTRLADGSYALPLEGRHVPTTHILKVPRRDEAGEVELEAASAHLAAAAGLDVSLPTPLDLGDTPALLVERFDRVIVDGTVYRLHQEDFAQALGLPAGLKYERNGTPDYRFDIPSIVSILDASREPALARERFLKATIFNLAIGNTDNHAKNHGLLYDSSPVPRLAPLYDLVPIRLNDRYRPDLSFRIGRANTFDAMERSDLEAFFATFDLEGSRLRRFAEGEIKPLLAKLESAASKLKRPQFKAFDNLIGRELSRLNDLLGLDLHIEARDSFETKGGGWQAS